MRCELSKVSYEERNNIGFLVINDPPANKMTIQFMMEFYVIVKEFISKSKVKGIIITGNGRHFSSGIEVDKLKECIISQTVFDSFNNVVEYSADHKMHWDTFKFFYDLDIPVVCAINGFCIGAGLELAMCTHIRICGKGSTLGSPESTFGFLPAVGGTLGFVKMSGLGRALEWVLSGAMFTPEEAVKMRIIHGIVGKKETLSYCEDLLTYIIENVSNYSKNNIVEYISNFNDTYLKV